MGRPHASSNAFRAVADPVRRRIIHSLAIRDRTVGELIRLTRKNAPSISHHLGILRHAGLVTQTRKGRTFVCSLNLAPLAALDAWLERLPRRPP